MRVKCRYTDYQLLEDPAVRLRLAESIRTRCGFDELERGMVYEVQAIQTWDDGGLRVYLDTLEHSDFPRPYPLELFEIIDGRLPADWMMAFDRTADGNVVVKRISFAAWANDDLFYERLVDAADDAVAVYQRQRQGANSFVDREALG